MAGGEDHRATRQAVTSPSGLRGCATPDQHSPCLAGASTQGDDRADQPRLRARLLAAKRRSLIATGLRSGRYIGARVLAWTLVVVRSSSTLHARNTDESGATDATQPPLSVFRQHQHGHSLRTGTAVCCSV